MPDRLFALPRQRRCLEDLCDQLPFNLAFLYCRLRQQKNIRSAKKTATTRAARIPLREEIEISSVKMKNPQQRWRWWWWCRRTNLCTRLTVSPEFHGLWVTAVGVHCRAIIKAKISRHDMCEGHHVDNSAQEFLRRELATIDNKEE